MLNIKAAEKTQKLQRSNKIFINVSPVVCLSILMILENFISISFSPHDQNHSKLAKCQALLWILKKVA